MQQVANCKICYIHGENKIISFNQTNKLSGVEYILQVFAFIERFITSLQVTHEHETQNHFFKKAVISISTIARIKLESLVAEAPCLLKY